MSELTLAVSHPVYSSKSDMVTAWLRELIITGAIAEGTPLRQRDLAEQFGVSPTPVREALRRLESQGLIVSDAHKGAVVASGDFGASKQNYTIRATLEALAASFAAENITEDELSDLEQIHRELSVLKSNSPRRSELNREFHFKIYAAAASPLLMALLRLLWEAFPAGPQQRSRPTTTSDKEHAKIIDALRRHDPDGASAATREHILDALRYLRTT